MSKSDGIWKINVVNPKNYALEVIYNSKMCFEGDAKNWKSLTDIKTIIIPANDSQIINIQENTMADYIAISFISGGTRFITYSYYLHTYENMNQNISKVTYNYYVNVGIEGKSGNFWIVNVTNTYGYRIKVEYNTKMCFEGDAKNWTGLNALDSFYLERGQSINIKIQENAFATHIAISFVSETMRIIRYANELNSSGTMNVLTNTINIYKYISITNLGKSGSKWLIKITNPTTYGIFVEYNSKMCGEGDAKNWTRLKNISSFYIDGGQTRQVAISTNFFATHITISYINNGRRLITYANGLSGNGNINILNNYI